MFAYRGQPFENNADGVLGYAYKGQPFVGNSGVTIGKFRIDSSLNFYSSGNHVVIGTKVSFKSDGTVEASAFNVVPGVFSINSDGSISANSFTQNATL